MLRRGRKKKTKIRKATQKREKEIVFNYLKLLLFRKDLVIYNNI